MIFDDDEPEADRLTQLRGYEQYHVSKISENHHATTKCWCEPFLIYKDMENGNEVWEHREIQ